MNSNTFGRCTVCGKPLTERREFEGRHYCDNHLVMFAEDFQPLWQASAISFAVTLLLIAAIGLSGQILRIEVNGGTRQLVSATVALLPASTWLIVLYRSALRSNRPISPLLPTVVVLAGLVAAAIIRPFHFQIIDLDLWLTRTTASNRLLGNILLAGFLHTFVLYALIRFTVWRTPTFDRRADGVLYTIAAAMGYAAVLNLLNTLDMGGVTLLNGNLRTLTHYCNHIAGGLIIGLFLGRNRFEDMPFYYLPAGFVLAAAVNGLLLFTGTELNNTRISFTAVGYTPWPGLVVNLLLLVVTYVSVSSLMRRQNRLTRGRLEARLG